MNKTRKNVKTKAVKTVDKAQRKKNIIKAAVSSVLVVAILVVSVVGFCNILTGSRVKQMYKQQEKAVKVLRTASDNAELYEIVLTRDDLATFDDTKAKEILLKTNPSMQTNFDKYGSTIADVYNGVLSASESPIKYEQCIPFSEFIASRVPEEGLTSLGYEFLFDSYLINLSVVKGLLDGEIAIQEIYDDLYEEYNQIEHPVNLTAPFELKYIEQDFVIDTNLRVKLNNVNTMIHRIVEVYYYNNYNQYVGTYGSDEVLMTMHFDPTAESIKDLNNLLLLSCNNYTIAGGAINLNLKEEDTTKLDEANAKLQKTMKKVEALMGNFNEETEEIEIPWYIKINQFITGFDVNKSEEINTNMQLKLQECYKTMLMPLTEQERRDITYDFIFWNSFFGYIDFTSGSCLTRTNYLQGRLDYYIIDEGNYIIEGSDIKSLLWVQAVTTFFNDCYSNCYTDFDEEGNPYIADDDEVSNSMLSLIQAWYLYGVQYTPEITYVLDTLLN